MGSFIECLGCGVKNSATPGALRDPVYFILWQDSIVMPSQKNQVKNQLEWVQLNFLPSTARDPRFCTPVSMPWYGWLRVKVGG